MQPKEKKIKSADKDNWKPIHILIPVELEKRMINYLTEQKKYENKTHYLKMLIAKDLAENGY